MSIDRANPSHAAKDTCDLFLFVIPSPSAFLGTDKVVEGKPFAAKNPPESNPEAMLAYRSPFGNQMIKQDFAANPTIGK
jgi:hypothetical protein